jgi:hypothetical protein
MSVFGELLTGLRRERIRKSGFRGRITVEPDNSRGSSFYGAFPHPIPTKEEAYKIRLCMTETGLATAMLRYKILWRIYERRGVARQHDLGNSLF